MEDKITKEKIHKYRDLTSKALKLVKNSIAKGKNKEAKEIIDMVSNYVSDSEYFEISWNFLFTCIIFPLESVILIR